MKQQKSILALAGSQILSGDIKPKYNSSNKKKYQTITNKSIQYRQPSNFLPKYKAVEPERVKQLIKKLGLSRLRKMQALVRGFLCRRLIYPVKLQQYLISNTNYNECSSILVESVTLGKYDNLGSISQQKWIEDKIYQTIVSSMISKQVQQISRQAVYEVVKYNSRPEITFGLNLRDPIELTLYLLIVKQIQIFCKQITEDCLVEEASYRRQIVMIDNLIQSMQVVKQICFQIVQQTLQKGISEYICASIINNICKEGAEVIAYSVYSKQISDVQNKNIQQISQQAEQWLLQEVINQTLLNYNFGKQI